MAGVLKKIFAGEEAEKPVKKVAKPIANSAVSPKDRKVLPEAYKTVCHPLITEKATDLAAINKYCFVVEKSANKTEVGKIVKNLYSVNPTKINFIPFGGKSVRHGNRFGTKKEFKKAIITVREGEKIEIYEGV